VGGFDAAWAHRARAVSVQSERVSVTAQNKNSLQLRLCALIRCSCMSSLSRILLHVSGKGCGTSGSRDTLAMDQQAHVWILQMSCCHVLRPAVRCAALGLLLWAMNTKSSTACCLRPAPNHDTSLCPCLVNGVWGGLCYEVVITR
jgi:hypothetical protein